MDATILAALRNSLVKLYSHEADIRRVCHDAGIAATRVSLNTSPLNAWNAVLKEANNAARLDALFQITTDEYPANQELRTALAAYYRARGEPFLHQAGDAMAVDEQAHASSPSAPPQQRAVAPTPMTTMLMRVGMAGIVLILVTAGLIRLMQYFVEPELAPPTTALSTATLVATTSEPTAVAEPPIDTPTDGESTVASTPNVQPVIIDMNVARATAGENEYVIAGTGIETVELGDLLVVYAKDAAGFEFDVAVIYIVDKNVDNVLGKVIFQNPDVLLDSLAALRADNNLGDVNLARMAPIAAIFAGFTLEAGRIRLNSNREVHVGDELSAVEFITNGDAIAFSPPRILQVSALSIKGGVANASLIGTSPWPPYGTLLIAQQ